MKTTTKLKSVTYSLLTALAILMSISLKSQSLCNANFNYTINANGNVTFESTSTGTNSNTNYYWVFSNSNFAYTQIASANFSYNVMYNVCLFISDSLTNCSSSFCDSIIITTPPASSCNANFSYSVGANGNVSFFNTSTGTNSNTVYYWSFNNTSTATVPNPVATFTNTYYNWVCLSISDSVTFCSSSKCDSIIIPQNPSGIKKQEHDLSINTRLYPNPAKDKAFLSINSSKESKLTISIYEITGKLLIQKIVDVNEGDNKVELEINSLNDGLYFVNITDGLRKKTLRLIKD